MTVPRRAPGDDVRVLIVDDSIFMRRALERQLAMVPGITVIGSASDGIEGVKRVLELRPDVVTMDVEMPRMDGVTAVSEIMKTIPTPIVMVSTLTTAGAETTLRALEAGAVDYVAKPSGAARDIENLGRALGEAVLHAKHARVQRRHGPSLHTISSQSPRPATTSRLSQRLVVVGSSTGGPPALTEVFSRLPGDLEAGFVIVQHMPAGFTSALARRLDGLSAIEVREASNGDLVRDGVALLAPGDFHLMVRKGGKISLGQGDPVHGVRPAIDITLASALDAFGSNTTVAILTGMGRDGAEGAAKIEQAGGNVIVQDEPTSVVYGMPRMAMEATQHATEAALPDVARAISRSLRRTG